MAWIITSSARVEQYCGYIFTRPNSFNDEPTGLLLILAVNQESRFLIDVKVQDRPEFR